MRERSFLTLNSYSRLDTCTEGTLELRNLALPIKEYGRRLRRIRGTSPIALDQLTFISTYKDGLFRPDRCDVYEPIKDVFDPSDLATPALWLSQPRGRVMLKKRRPFYYEGFIENRRHQRIWIGGSQEPEPLSPDPVFLTELCLWFDMKVLRVLSEETVIEFFIDFYLQLKGEYGYLSIPHMHAQARW